MSGGVPPSSRARTRPLPKNAQVRKAANLYERFSGHEALECGEVNIPPMPKVGVAIGKIDGVMYTTVRDGVIEKYIHQFHKGDEPMFIVSPNGKQLFMVGGRFDFTERGIVDKSDKSR